MDNETNTLAADLLRVSPLWLASLALSREVPPLTQLALDLPAAASRPLLSAGEIARFAAGAAELANAGELSLARRLLRWLLARA